MKGYRKTVNHSRGTVRETVTNPVTGTRHVYTRKRTTVKGFFKGLGYFLAFLVAFGLLRSIFGKKTTVVTLPEKSAVTETKAAEETKASEQATEPTETTEFKGFVMDYLVNDETKTVHRPNASHAGNNVKTVNGTLADIEAMGYKRCGTCWK